MTNVLTEELHQISELLLQDGHVYHGHIVREGEEMIHKLRAALAKAVHGWERGLNEYESDPRALYEAKCLL